MIDVKAVSKSFGGRQVLSEVSLRAANGQVTGFVGPNGAGKTTVMKIVCGLLPADSGVALVDGRPFTAAVRPAATLGVHLGGDSLPDRATGYQLLRYAAEVTPCSLRSIPETLKATGMEQAQHARIGTYSLGMRQRLGLALALIGDPNNLMLDEPVNGLDPHGVIWLRDLLRAEADNGKAVLLSSHLMAELELVADRVVMVNDGRVLSDGELGRVGDRTGHVLIRSAHLPEVLMVLRDGGYTTKPLPGGAMVETDDPTEIGRIVFGAGLTLSHLEVRTASLEERFLTVTRPEPMRAGKK